MKWMQVNGAALAYVAQGRGAPVVFVHGSSSDHRLWEPQREAVARHFRYIAYDQRYFGTANWPDGGASFSSQVQIDDLAGFLGSLDVGPAHLVGWSMSGDAILGVAMRYPGLVRSAFLHEPSLRGLVLDPERIKRVREDFRSVIVPALAAMCDCDLAAIVRMFMDGVNNQAGTFDALPDWLQRMATDNVRTLPLQFAAPPPPRITCRDLYELDIPVTITCGDQTRTCYRIVAGAASQCLRHARLITIPGARHLWPVQAPAAFNATLLDFLRAWHPGQSLRASETDDDLAYS